MRRLGSAIMALLGIWALVTSPDALAYAGVLAASLLGNGFSMRHQVLVGLVAISPFLLALAFGFGLILARDGIAAALFDESPVGDGADPAALIGAAVLVLGLWFSVVSVTGLLRSAAGALTTVAFNTGGPRGVDAIILRQQLTSFGVQVFAFVVEFGAGVFLIMRSREVAVWALRRQEPDA